MSKPSDSLFKTLQDRGFIYQCTNLPEVEKLLDGPPIKMYVGFDCTATSLHVGHLLQIMFLYWCQKFGHQPIVVLGGATSLIGDPTGRNKTRPNLTKAKITANAHSIKENFKPFLNFEGDNPALLLNNLDWIAQLGYLDFLSHYGKTISVNNMLKFDTIAQRINEKRNLTFTEFNYSLLQAYDFAHLSKEYGCRLQIGGCDQWNNILQGVNLVDSKSKLYGLTTPLLVKKDGTKMGKTADGAVWLAKDLLSPYDYYQFWRNMPDDNFIQCLKWFTTLSMDEINTDEEILKSPDISAKEKIDKLTKLKEILAYEATKLLHGEKLAELCQQKSCLDFHPVEFFSGAKLVGEISENITPLKPSEISKKNSLDDSKASSSKEKKWIRVTDSNSEQQTKHKQVYFLDLILRGTNYTKSEAKRLVRGSGARINGKIITDPFYIIADGNFCFDGKNLLRISLGKKKHFLYLLKRTTNKILFLDKKPA